MKKYIVDSFVRLYTNGFCPKHTITCACQFFPKFILTVDQDYLEAMSFVFWLDRVPRN